MTPSLVRCHVVNVSRVHAVALILTRHIRQRYIFNCLLFIQPVICANSVATVAVVVVSVAFARSFQYWKQTATEAATAVTLRRRFKTKIVIMESNINENRLINSENVIEGKSIIHALMPSQSIWSMWWCRCAYIVNANKAIQRRKKKTENNKLVCTHIDN